MLLRIIRRILGMPRPETETTRPERRHADLTWTMTSGGSFASGGSFVGNIYADTGTDIEYEWALEQGISEHFRGYIDEDCECPTRRKMDEATVRLARVILNHLETTNQMDMGEHEDMIFESAQRIVRAIAP